MAVQRALDSDIVMIFDECTPYPATEAQARASMELSLAWAPLREATATTRRPLRIVQGGIIHTCGGIARRPARGRIRRLRPRGLSVGEPKEEMLSVLERWRRPCPAIGRAT